MWFYIFTYWAIDSSWRCAGKLLKAHRSKQGSALPLHPLPVHSWGDLNKRRFLLPRSTLERSAPQPPLAGALAGGEPGLGRSGPRSFRASVPRSFRALVPHWYSANIFRSADFQHLTRRRIGWWRTASLKRSGHPGTRRLLRGRADKHHSRF